MLSKGTKRPPVSIRLKVLGAVDYATEKSLIASFKKVSERGFLDELSGESYKFTWSTISTWYYRYKKEGLHSIDNKVRCDKNINRKVSPEELAEAIKTVLPELSNSKKGRILKSSIYTKLLQKCLFTREQLSKTSFYRIVGVNDLLDPIACKKLRKSFSMVYANDLWQADTMYGPTIKQNDGRYRKTFLIAFIDDASRVITHAEFFYNDNTESMIHAFRMGLYKRGKPERLYFDNGSNYSSKEIHQACIRLNILLTHAPVRDGAAKGKIERFFRGYRDRFLTMHLGFDSLEDLNKKTNDWIEKEYNSSYHSGIQMKPIDRFNIDRDRIKYIHDDEYTKEIFLFETKRKVDKTNVFSLLKLKYECPVDLRKKRVEIRYDRPACKTVIVYFNKKRMGKATLLNLHLNSDGIRKNRSNTGGKND